MTLNRQNTPSKPKVIEVPCYDPITEDGLIDITADFSPERMLAYYHHGIFSWFREQGLVYWFAPEMRLVIKPEAVYVSHSMKQLLKSNRYTVTMNQAFDEVVDACSKPRPYSRTTWLDADFKSNYRFLHSLGICTSVEVWDGDQLAGGLFGTWIGNVFSGESMFSRQPNTSKLALIHFCLHAGAELIDCQAYSHHLASMGGVLIPCDEYKAILARQSKCNLLRMNVSVVPKFHFAHDSFYM